MATNQFLPIVNEFYAISISINASVLNPFIVPVASVVLDLSL